MKVSTIVGDATRIGNSSVNSTEEERKEVEEKVIWIFQKCFSTYPKVARYAKSVKGTQLRWSWNNKSKRESTAHCQVSPISSRWCRGAWKRP